MRPDYDGQTDKEEDVAHGEHSAIEEEEQAPDEEEAACWGTGLVRADKSTRGDIPPEQKATPISRRKEISRRGRRGI